MAMSSDGRDRFTILPIEMLQAIASNLDLKDALKLRLLLRKTQEDALIEIFKQTLKTTPLYVSPVKRSLQRYKNICDHPFFSRFIKNVIFVALALNVDPGEHYGLISVTLDEYQGTNLHQKSALTPQSYVLYRRFLAEHTADYVCFYPGSDGRLARLLQ